MTHGLALPVQQQAQVKRLAIGHGYTDGKDKEKYMQILGLRIKQL